jgi:hypothetical protein
MPLLQQASIVSHLKNNPKHLETAIKAINTGISEAMDKLREIASESDRAFLCALGLLDNKRLTEDVKTQLNSIIVEKIKKVKIDVS